MEISSRTVYTCLTGLVCIKSDFFENQSDVIILVLFDIVCSLYDRKTRFEESCRELNVEPAGLSEHSKSFDSTPCVDAAYYTQPHHCRGVTECLNNFIVRLDISHPATPEICN